MGAPRSKAWLAWAWRSQWGETAAAIPERWAAPRPAPTSGVSSLRRGATPGGSPIGAEGLGTYGLRGAERGRPSTGPRPGGELGHRGRRGGPESWAGVGLGPGPDFAYETLARSRPPVHAPSAGMGSSGGTPLG